MKLLIQHNGKKFKIEVEEMCSVGILKVMLEPEVDIPKELMTFSVLNKEINAYDESLLINVGITNMTAVRVGRLDVSSEVKQGTGRGGYIPKIDKFKLVAVRRKMPGDNSCCFHCLEYLFNKKSRADPTYIRDDVSNIVAAYPQKFTTDYLGMPNPVYVENIRNPRTWGSNVEINIYSFLKECRIVVFDFENQIDVTYGGSDYNRCCFIIYTGNHFDVLSLAPSVNSQESEDQVLFNSSDEEVYKKMKNFISAEHPKFKFTF
ncbi:Ubiquitin thioesterase OTU [Entamoeba marina]